jgi:hypothetical protein
MPEVRRPAPRWLLLLHQLPAKPSNLRVHIWRRLQQVGAIALRKAIYVLPDTAESREDFEWIRSEIASRGGQVSILAADALDGYTDEELQSAFRSARTADYDALIARARAVGENVGRRKKEGHRRATLQKELSRLRDRFQALRATDFFHSPRAVDAQTAIGHLESQLRQQVTQTVSADPLEPRFFRRRQWLTRPRPGIDRFASAWLIRRFIAPDAKFVFGGLPAGAGQIPFDMPDVEFGHHGNDCTYETLLRRFAIADAAAVRIGHVVHDLDLKESRYGLPETTTVARLVEGLRQTIEDDGALLQQGMQLIAALHASFAAEHRSQQPRAPRRPRLSARRRVRA